MSRLAVAATVLLLLQMPVPGARAGDTGHTLNGERGLVLVLVRGAPVPLDPPSVPGVGMGVPGPTVRVVRPPSSADGGWHGPGIPGEQPSPGPIASPLPPGPLSTTRPLGFLQVLQDLGRTLLHLLARATGFMVLWSRIEGAKLLDHPLRRAIVEEVAEQPGLHVGELARRLNAHPKTVAYHLRHLARGRHVDLVRDGPLLRVLPVARPPGAAPPPSTRRRLLGLLDEGPMRREHLARALGITPQAVSYHARALERLGLVCVRRRGRVAEVMLRAPDRAR